MNQVTTYEGIDAHKKELFIAMPANWWSSGARGC
jgi:hypothetical protein